MSTKVRRIAVIVGATGLLGATAGCGATSTTSSSSGAQGAASQPPSQQQAPRAGAPDLSALAGKLGVSTAQLQKAIQTAGPPSPGADRIAALATALGLSEAKVRAAMQATRPNGAPPGGSPAQQPPSGQSAA